MEKMSPLQVHTPLVQTSQQELAKSKEGSRIQKSTGLKGNFVEPWQMP